MFCCSPQSSVHNPTRLLITLSFESLEYFHSTAQHHHHVVVMMMWTVSQVSDAGQDYFILLGWLLWYLTFWYDKHPMRKRWGIASVSCFISTRCQSSHCATNRAHYYIYYICLAILSHLPPAPPLSNMEQVHFQLRLLPHTQLDFLIQWEDSSRFLALLNLQ